MRKGCQNCINSASDDVTISVVRRHRRYKVNVTSTSSVGWFDRGVRISMAREHEWYLFFEPFRVLPSHFHYHDKHRHNSVGKWVDSRSIHHQMMYYVNIQLMPGRRRVSSDFGFMRSRHKDKNLPLFNS